MNHQITPNPWTSLFVFSGDIPKKGVFFFGPKKGPIFHETFLVPPARATTKAPSSEAITSFLRGGCSWVFDILTSVSTFLFGYLCTHTKSHTQIYIYIFVNICIYIYIMIPIIAYCKLCKYIYMYIHIYVCVYVCYMNNMDKNLLR